MKFFVVASLLGFLPTATALVHLDVSHLHAISHSSLSFVNHHVQSVAHSYTDALHSHPLITKMLTGGTLATTGDAIAQSRSEEPYDKRRAFSFMSFDMAYRALQHVSFPLIVTACHGQYLGNVLPMFPQDGLAAMEQTLASQLGIVPFLYYPVFFGLTGFVQGLTPRLAMDRAKENFFPLMKRNLMFWIPVQFFQFGYIDEQFQVPFLSVAGLCWTFILSMAAGSTKSYSTPSRPQHSVVADEEDEELVYTSAVARENAAA